ncbi:MAG: TetR/AcrR family transcriptional regulator [Shimia sp.]|nr:TetR/AcrR family transcriptional regulator [Shimia sp.]MCP4825460.1 TetR/AcrR family transcriptional regulator [Shimia sp.]
MLKNIPQEKQRQRAPSKRALETRARILDAAERVFARSGFDAASIRDIAAEAEVQGALVNHHGGSKEELFWRVVARRADVLADARIAALEARKAQGALTVPAIMDCFFGPFFERIDVGGPQWVAYARIVAFVSADARWKDLAAICFDPTASRFVEELAELYAPQVRSAVASGFVYAVASMLALITSQWRMEALGDTPINAADHLDQLVAFCAAGIGAAARSAETQAS